MFEENLTQLGFDDRETRAYLELLRAGMQPVALLSNRLRLNRGTTYAVMKRLERKGMVSSYICNGMRFFAANDPNALMGYLDMRSVTLEYHRTELIKVIPQLRSLMADGSFCRPVVSYFEGADGVKSVMYDVLKSDGNCFCAYMPLEKCFKGYRDLCVSMKQLCYRAIVPDVPKVRAFFDEYYSDGNDGTEILYVGGKELSGLFCEGLNVYGEKVAMIHLDAGEEYGVLIESKEIAAAHRHIFEINWKALAVNGEVIRY